MKPLPLLLFALSLLITAPPVAAQKLENEAVRQMIEQYRNDSRGPYKDIRWFCKDGSVIQPKEKCPDGGVQRARYKDAVAALGRSNHIYLGQILSNTAKEEFWDAEYHHSRLKQYQLEKYLRAVDDGWVLQKGQYYRGAIQAEDEEEWGGEFLRWALGNDQRVKENFFLIRQAAKDLPHGGDDRKTLNVRAVSKAISEEYTPFMDLRVKIHGQPEASDIRRVEAFREQHNSKLSAGLQKKFAELLTDMAEVYRPIVLSSLNPYLNRLPKDAAIRLSLADYVQQFNNDRAGAARSMATAEKLYEVRQELLSVSRGSARLALLDISNKLEEILFNEIANWQTPTLEDLLDKVCYLGTAAAGGGYIEEWEWQQINGDLIPPAAAVEEMELAALNQYLERANALVEWSAGMTRGIYGEVVALYSGFEPLAYGFLDDRIRGSVLLPLGQTVGQLGDFAAAQASLSNHLMDLSNQSRIRGVNPGYALGELVVVSGSEDDIEVSNNKIYIFNRPPADLKPVAGIATVTEGNMVSHVQLLARNLGIPNAVLSAQNLQDLEKYAGRKVFYAVSNKGTVLMKTADKMTPEEEQLFAAKTRSETRIRVPVDKVQLDQTNILNMRELDATFSGKVCGPKAANLAQLKVMFPDKVVEGLVIPFGLFRKHMDQPMPGESGSYWQYLNEVFQTAETMRKQGKGEAEVEAYQLAQLEILRNAIKNIELFPDFVNELKADFTEVFGKNLGQIPVFLRSDTNMEDLKDFTGAGLNLTLFNVVTPEKILQGIKDVWASPYTERSFKWRQRYLLNPENVFPSILIIPSVDVDYSGVLITKGITNGSIHDLTVAFSRGAGGAVDGQAAESYLQQVNGRDKLLSPAREPYYNRLPESGGTQRKIAAFNEPILNKFNRYDIRVLADEVRERMPNTPGVDSRGPFDVELGFKDDRVWLFQIRPFVENKNAVTSTYLESITPKIPENKMIRLSTKI